MRRHLAQRPPLANKRSGALDGPAGAYVNQQWTCKIRMTAGGDGKLKDDDLKGPRSGCDAANKALAALIRKPA
jgi:hypothetical protein